MEKPFRASFKDALLVSTVPFFLKGISLFAGNLKNSLFQKNPSPSGEHHFILWINDQLIPNNVYSSYIAFMGTMAVLSLIVFFLKKMSSYQSILLSQNQQKHPDVPQETALMGLEAGEKYYPRREALKKFSKFLICYTLIFGIIQLMSFILMNNSSFKNNLINKNTLDLNFQDQEQVVSTSLRNLGEQISSGIEEDAEKFLLPSAMNAGQVLGSFHYDAQDANKMAFVMSHDGKTLFVFESSWFKIYNISDPKKAELVGLPFRYDLGYWLQSMSVVLSPDDQYLFIHSLTHFHIIHLSNMDYDKPCFSKEFLIPFTHLQALISMTISPDGKTLYLLKEERFTIYDISDACNPKALVYSDYKTRTLKRIPRSSPRIALSKDSSLAAVASIPAFEILDVSDPSDPLPIYLTISLRGCATGKGLKNLEDGEQIFSVAFSDDEEKLLLGVLDKDYNISLQILNITSLDSPSLLSSLKIDQDSEVDVKLGHANLWFHPNKEFAFFYSRNEFRMISIAEMEQTTLFSSLSDLRCRYFASSADGTRNIIHFARTLITMKFNIDVPPKSLSHFKPSSFKVIDEVNFNRKLAIALSTDGKMLYLVEEVDKIQSQFHFLKRYERVNNVSLVKLEPTTFYSTDRKAFQPWPNAFWNLAAGKDLYVISYFPNIKMGNSSLIAGNDSLSLSFSGQPSSNYSTIPSFAFPSHEKWIAFITDNYGNGTNLTLKIVSLDLRILLSQVDLPLKNSSYLTSSMKINKNDTLLFYTNCDLLIYNITNPKSPTLEVSYGLNVSKTIGFALSENEQILYHFGVGLDKKRKLQILDISKSSPELTGSLIIEPYSEVTNSTELSPDGKVLYLGFSNGMLMIDVRNSSQPVLLGFNYYLGQPHALTFVRNEKLFYTVSSSGVSLIDMTEQYILDLKTSDLKIGGSYAIRPYILRLNKDLKFDFMTKKYKFLNFGVFGNKSASNAEPSTTLPTWIDFDKERSTLVIEPKLTASSYKISAILSIQTEPSAFLGLESIDTEDEAKKLYLNLFHYGYIDKQGYITEVLDFNQQMWLDSQYSTIEKEIRAILAVSYIEAIGEFSVSPSLDISLEASSIKISTLSKGTISVSIQLSSNETGRNPSFVAKPYPNIKSAITNKKSLLLLDGSLEDVNEALKEVLVDFDKETFSQAIITVSDGLNPKTSRNISSLSKHFIENKEPTYLGKDLIELALEAQLKKQQPFQTGIYSGIEFDKNTFKDENNLTLEYSLEMPDPKEHTPSWINLRGLNLIATPIETYSTFSYDFVLVAKNELRKTAVPFKLNVQISLSYGFKLLTTIAGYVISLFGLVYTINKVYNFLARKYYRYPRSFKLKVGDQITDKTIFPLSFIKTEINLSKKLCDELEKYIAKNCEKVKGHYKNQLLDILIDPELEILDQGKVISILDALNNKDYNQADQCSKDIIQRLIVNKVVSKQLANKKESETRKVFGKIKNQWMDFVIATSSSPSQFIINSDTLNAELSKICPPDQEGEEDGNLLLAKSKYNMNLLHNAILAHAFNFQNFEIETIYIDVVSHKKLKGNSLYFMLKKLLQKDIKPFVFLNKREIGYGIEYVVKKNTLHFIGQLIQDLKDDIIVVHLKNNKGKILRELWIAGENQTMQEQDSILKIQEQEETSIQTTIHEQSLIQNTSEIL